MLCYLPKIAGVTDVILGYLPKIAVVSGAVLDYLPKKAISEWCYVVLPT